MKQVVMDFVKSMGCTAAYSGKLKKMFIKGKTKKEAAKVEQLVIDQYGFGLPFALASQKR